MEKTKTLNVKKRIHFTKGRIVYDSENAILITGKGGPDVSYPCFSGVVIMARNAEGDECVYPVGTYSQSWTRGAAWKLLETDLSSLIEKIIIP